jgi:hypothetical protein
MADASTLFQNSDGTTAAVAADDPVGHVRDKSPNARHMTQPTNNARPLLNLSAQNGRSALRFDGTNDFLVNANNFLTGSPVSIAMVAQREANSSVSSVASAGRGGASAPEVTFEATLRNAFLSPNNDVRVSSGNARRNGGASLDAGTSPTTFMIVTGGGATNQNSVNAADGVLLGSLRDAAGNASAFLLNGRIGEVILYSRFLSLSERQALERYLSVKWGIGLTP